MHEDLESAPVSQLRRVEEHQPPLGSRCPLRARLRACGPYRFRTERELVASVIEGYGS